MPGFNDQPTFQDRLARLKADQARKLADTAARQEAVQAELEATAEAERLANEEALIIGRELAGRLVQAGVPTLPIYDDAEYVPTAKDIEEARLRGLRSAPTIKLQETGEEGWPIVDIMGSSMDFDGYIHTHGKKFGLSTDGEVLVDFTDAPAQSEGKIVRPKRPKSEEALAILEDDDFLDGIAWKLGGNPVLRIEK